MKRFSQDSGDLVNEEGTAMPCSEAQERIRQSIERTGRFILGSDHAPYVGQVEQFAGLPFRVVRMINEAEAKADAYKLRDLWDDPFCSPHAHYFEVEVAD